MKRTLSMMALMVIAMSLSAVAVDWVEVDWSATVVSDHKTGKPAIVFNTGLAYDEKPAMMQLRIAWEVFRVDGEVETMLYEYSRTTSRSSAVSQLWTASESVLIEEGSRYGARVQIDDLENGLSHRRSYMYIVPEAQPVGLRFVGWDGTQEADLAAMSDKDLEELVQLKQDLASYEVLAEGISISSFFSQHVTSAANYPVSVILLPDTGVANNWGSESQPIIVTFGLTILTFTIPSADAKAGFQQQMATYDQTFTGTAYAGPGGGTEGEAAVIFLHDAMSVMLNEAVAELASRST